MTIPSSQDLVQMVIDEFRLHPEKLGGTPTPIVPEVLEKLTFPDGKPLPPSLKQWLAFDAACLGLFSDLANLVITPLSLSTSFLVLGLQYIIPIVQVKALKNFF